MGITIEQHRAPIGSYYNSARIKYMSSYIQRCFWNTSAILALLARSLYLLGCIVYVTLLSRMANNVKKIPAHFMT